MKEAIREVERRRGYQISYNQEHNIIPTNISKPIREKILEKEVEEDTDNKLLDLEKYEFKVLSKKQQKEIIKDLENKMKEAAKLMEFESAAKLRDEVIKLKQLAK